MSSTNNRSLVQNGILHRLYRLRPHQLDQKGSRSERITNTERTLQKCTYNARMQPHARQELWAIPICQPTSWLGFEDFHMVTQKNVAWEKSLNHPKQLLCRETIGSFLLLPTRNQTMKVMTAVDIRNHNVPLMCVSSSINPTLIRCWASLLGGSWRRGLLCLFFLRWIP